MTPKNARLPFVGYEEAGDDEKIPVLQREVGIGEAQAMSELPSRVRLL